MDSWPIHTWTLSSPLCRSPPRHPFTLAANPTFSLPLFVYLPPIPSTPHSLPIRTAEAVRIYDLLNADRIVVESRALDFLNAQFGLDLGEEEPEVEGELSHTAA